MEQATYGHRASKIMPKVTCTGELWNFWEESNLLAWLTTHQLHKLPWRNKPKWNLMWLIWLLRTGYHQNELIVPAARTTRCKMTPIQRWDATNALGLWWTDKMRRVDASHSASRKLKEQPQSHVSDELDWSFSDWENWLDSDKESEHDSDLSS